MIPQAKFFNLQFNKGLEGEERHGGVTVTLSTDVHELYLTVGVSTHAMNGSTVDSRQIVVPVGKILDPDSTYTFWRDEVFPPHGGKE